MEHCMEAAAPGVGLLMPKESPGLSWGAQERLWGPRCVATAQPLISSGCDWAKGHFPFSGWETRLRSRSSLCEETWQRQMLSSHFPPLFLLIPFSCWSCGHGLRVAQGRVVISAQFSNRGILYAPTRAGNTEYNPSGLIPPSLLDSLLCKWEQSPLCSLWQGANHTADSVSEHFISTSAFQISERLQNTALQCLCTSMN